MVIHYEEALYQMYAPLPYLYLLMQSRSDDVHSDMQDVGVSDETRQSQINCTRCIICQTDTDEPLQCPANSK